MSQHLAMLRDHGIADNRRDGNVVYDRLLAPRVCNILACATEVLRERR